MSIVILSFKLIIKIYRNQILSPQQMQTIASNNNHNSQPMSSAYPLVHFFSASMFGKENTHTHQSLFEN